MKITRIAQSCFRLELAEKIIYIDPYKIPFGGPKADIILISHPHRDHFHKGSFNSISQQGTVVVCPKTCPKILKQASDGRGLNPNEEIDIGNLKVVAVPAYNRKKPFHSRNKKWIGFLIKAGSKTLYHAGDTDFIPEMADLAVKSIDIAFLPIGGFFTMDIQAAANAAKAIKPRIVIPMHEMKKSPEKLRDLLQDELSNLQVIYLHNGETYKE